MILKCKSQCKFFRFKSQKKMIISKFYRKLILPIQFQEKKIIFYETYALPSAFNFYLPKKFDCNFHLFISAIKS